MNGITVAQFDYAAPKAVFKDTLVDAFAKTVSLHIASSSILILSTTSTRRVGVRVTFSADTGITDAGVASDTSDAITKYLASDFASDYNNACQAAGLSLQVSSSSATATVGATDSHKDQASSSGSDAVIIVVLLLVTCCLLGIIAGITYCYVRTIEGQDGLASKDEEAHKRHSDDSPSSTRSSTSGNDSEGITLSNHSGDESAQKNTQSNSQYSTTTGLNIRNHLAAGGVYPAAAEPAPQTRPPARTKPAKTKPHVVRGSVRGSVQAGHGPPSRMSTVGPDQDLKGMTVSQLKRLLEGHGVPKAEYKSIFNKQKLIELIQMAVNQENAPAGGTFNFQTGHTLKAMHESEDL